MIDDILALLLVAVAVGIAADGGVDIASILISAGLAFGFVAVFALGGTALMRRAPQLLHAPRFSDSPLLPAVILCLGIAALAAKIGLAAVIGAFLAGMIVAETKEQHPIEDEIAPLYAFFTPFFFASIGLALDLGRPDRARDAAARRRAHGARPWPPSCSAPGPALAGSADREAKIVALGMVPRGEVGIIVAGIGCASGVVDERAVRRDRRHVDRHDPDRAAVPAAAGRRAPPGLRRPRRRLRPTSRGRFPRLTQTAACGRAPVPGLLRHGHSRHHIPDRRSRSSPPSASTAPRWR